MYIFRADGNAQIGAGHLMRCMTIAQALGGLLGNRAEILFVCADENSARMALDNGFQARSLGTDYQDMEAELRGQPMFIWQEITGKGMPGQGTSGNEATKTVILVDSYYVTKAYLKGLCACGTVFLMDDMQRQSFPVDAVINYNLFADRAVYQRLYEKTKTKLYLGGEYVPVRSQFLNQPYRVSEKATEILITTGGGDVDNIAGEIFQRVNQEGLHFHLIMGRFSPHFQRMKALEERCDNLTLHYDVKDMAGLMKGCDGAITAGGTTIYELAAIGVPMIAFSYAENQELLTQYLGEKNIACYAGAYHKNPKRTLDEIQRLLTQLCTNQAVRQKCFNKEKETIDGKGAERLAQKLMENSI